MIFTKSLKLLKALETITHKTMSRQPVILLVISNTRNIVFTISKHCIRD